MMPETLQISEIFVSIQGESTLAGKLCSFIRLSGCNLNCSYCDTQYARTPESGLVMPLDDIVSKVVAEKVNLVCISGGEPLCQTAVPELCRRLLEHDLTVQIETNGSLPIDQLPEGVIRVLDCKCPSSGEEEQMDWANFTNLKQDDEVKFVIGSRTDYEYAKGVISRCQLLKKTENLLFSPVFGGLKPTTLATWVREDRLPVRLQLQIQKYIWPVEMRRV